MQKYYICSNLGPAACQVQANITVLRLPIIETRTEVLLGLSRADGAAELMEARPPIKDLHSCSL